MLFKTFLDFAELNKVDNNLQNNAGSGHLAIPPLSKTSLVTSPAPQVNKRFMKTPA